MSDGKLLTIFCFLIKSFVQMLLSSNLSLFGKKNMYLTWPYWHYRKIKVQITFSKVSVRHETLFFKFFSGQWSNALKDFLSQFSTFTCNIIRLHIELPAYARTSCWSAKSISMSIRDDFINFKQIERYKANVDARSQISYFVVNISKWNTRLNHFQLKSFFDRLVRTFK